MSTLSIPPGTRLVGEAWSVLAGKGAVFEDQHNPKWSYMEKPILKMEGALILQMLCLPQLDLRPVR